MDRPFLNSVKYPRCPSRSFHALARGWVLFRRRRRSRHTPARGLPVVVVEALSTSLHLVWTVCLFPARYEPSFSISTVGLLAGGKAKTTNGSEKSVGIIGSSRRPPPVDGHDTQNLLGKTCFLEFSPPDGVIGIQCPISPPFHENHEAKRHPGLSGGFSTRRRL